MKWTEIKTDLPIDSITYSITALQQPPTAPWPLTVRPTRHRPTSTTVKWLGRPTTASTTEPTTAPTTEPISTWLSYCSSSISSNISNISNNNSNNKCSTNNISNITKPPIAITTYSTTPTSTSNKTLPDWPCCRRSRFHELIFYEFLCIQESIIFFWFFYFKAVQYQEENTEILCLFSALNCFFLHR